MSDSLTARQTQILKLLIDEYIETAEPVGSVTLEKKHNLGVSPATIRKEMVDLTQMKYLKQPHTSAGRVPTPKAMKFYIRQLMEEEQMSLAEEVKAKDEIMQAKRDFDRLMQEATKALAEQTESLAVAATDEGDVWRWGYPYLYKNPELASIQVVRSVCSVIEEAKRLHELLFEHLTGTTVQAVFGEDLGWDFFEPVGVVAAQFEGKGKKGAIGLVGPFGQNYSYIIPVVRDFGRWIQEALA